MISHLFIPQIVFHGKYHNFQIVFLYFCLCSSCLFINLLIFFFFYFLMTLRVLKEWRLAISLSVFLAAACSFCRLCFYQLSSYFSSFLHGFYINFYTSFCIIWRQGSINTTLEELFFCSSEKLRNKNKYIYLNLEPQKFEMCIH